MRWLLESVLMHRQVKMEMDQVLQQVGPIPMPRNKLGHCLSIITGNALILGVVVVFSKSKWDQINMVH